MRIESVTYQPIGIFRCENNKPYEALRQGVLSENCEGVIQLYPPITSACLDDLIGFERVWLLYDFHQNSSWKEKVRPPRGADKKRGVFATRSPYRPNSVGLSCVKLEKIERLKVYVSAHDLLNQTPILDIKPYLPYADSFSESSIGWVHGQKKYKVELSADILQSLCWLEERSEYKFRQILTAQLEYEPTNRKTKRVKPQGEGFVFSLQTWRFQFSVRNDVVSVFNMYSGYSEEDLNSAEDIYKDKNLHRDWLKTYPKS